MLVSDEDTGLSCRAERTPSGIRLNWQDAADGVQLLRVHRVGDFSTVDHDGISPGTGDIHFNTNQLFGDETLSVQFIRFAASSPMWSLIPSFTVNLQDFTGLDYHKLEGAGTRVRMEFEDASMKLLWFNPPENNYTLKLYQGSERILYGGHQRESARIDFESHQIDTSKPLTGNFIFWNPDAGWQQLPTFTIDLSAYYGPDFSCLSEAAMELLNILQQPYSASSYYDVEDAAQSLAPLADTVLIDYLLNQASSAEDGWVRRNALRVIGRLAGDPRSSDLVLSMKDQIRLLLLDRLENDRDENVIADVLWIADTYHYPFFEYEPYLQSMALDSAFSSSLRHRVMGCYQRLLFAKRSLLDDDDQEFLANILVTDDYWVRAYAAYCYRRLRSAQLDAALKSEILSTLQQQSERETVLLVQTYIADAIDHHSGSSYLLQLQEDYENQHLPTTGQSKDGSIQIRSGLESKETMRLVQLLEWTRNAYFDWMGSDFAAPIAGDPNEVATAIIFASREQYIEYMNAFVGYGAYAGGLYLEADATLYTFDRDSSTSSYSLDELLKHEYTHYLNARHVFPGIWGQAGYHEEAKGWANEGLAEFFAGVVFDEFGNAQIPPREVYLDQIEAPYRDLTSLLTQRDGYSHPGTFDYANAWSWKYYLMNEAPMAARDLFLSFRNETYQLEQFESITGHPIHVWETEWHATKDQLVANVSSDLTIRSKTTSTSSDPDDLPELRAIRIGSMASDDDHLLESLEPKTAP